MQRALKAQRYEDAIFFADKVLHLITSKNEGDFTQAVYDLATCYLLNKENLRCIELLDKYAKQQFSLVFKLLAARAHLNSNNVPQCLRILETDLQEDAQKHIFAEKYQLLAQAYEMMEDKSRTIFYLNEALKADCQSVAAFNKLLDNHLMPKEDLQVLLDQMTFTPECMWLKDYYLSRIHVNLRPFADQEGIVRIKIGDTNSSHLVMASEQDDSGLTPKRFQADEDHMHSLRNPQTLETSGFKGILSRTHVGAQTPSDNSFLQTTDLPFLDLLHKRENADVKLIEAQRLNESQQFQRAKAVIEQIINDDSYYTAVIPLYCSILIQASQKGQLYNIAHKLCNADPDSAVSWFAVGCHYFLTKKYDLARRYFNKANKLDKHFCPSWIAFGHAYSAQDESDPAMSAYRTAARLFPGCHQASLYIGMEYLRMNNLKTALWEFKQALKLSPTDPAVLNEIGVVYYQQGDFEAAIHSLQQAMIYCGTLSEEAKQGATYEAITLNLGHCYRKIKQVSRLYGRNYSKALELYELCSNINPKCPQAYISMGLTHHLTFDLMQALKFYHKAHFLKAEDSMIEELISQAMGDITNTEVNPLSETFLKMEIN